VKIEQAAQALLDRQGYLVIWARNQYTVGEVVSDRFKLSQNSRNFFTAVIVGISNMKEYNEQLDLATSWDAFTLETLSCMGGQFYRVQVE
jgi:hypothetical protein